MFWVLIGKCYGLLRISVEFVLNTLVFIAIIIAVANHVGWLNRWIFFILEKEAKKATQTKVTIGSFTIEWSELLQGKITLHASNVIIHTPQRDEWRWDSPLIARIGKATVECNAIITIFHAVFLRQEVPIEAYTIVVSDVQVFIERRESVINVYLLNPTLQLPPPPFKKEKDQLESGKESAASNGNPNTTSLQEGSDLHATEIVSREDASERHNMSAENSVHASTQSDLQGSTTFFDTKSSVNPLAEDTSVNKDNHNQQAKALVKEMLHAVQDLGGAAARGQLPHAIKRQGLELVGRLKGFRQQENLEEGIRVMQQFGKVAVESLQSAPQLILPQPDTTRERKNKVIYIRIGRIVANDIRIFTKDSWINAKSNHNSSVDTTSENATGTLSSQQVNDFSNKSTRNIESDRVHTNNNGSWNRPIYIESMVLTSSELCPPMSMKDDKQLPALFQNVDKIMEVVWRRVLAEIAKSNTGKLFSTALGEMLSVMVSNPRHSISTGNTVQT